MARLTYRMSGVDIDAGDALVEQIKPLARATRRPEVLADVGGFAGLCKLPMGMREPVLVSGTDGVGTKLKIAFALGVHDTVGIDLVAMCANDVATVGAEPLFFLDYFATGKLDNAVATAVMRGIAEGCRRAGCSLLGGETAELPGFYHPGEYDLAGFCVGVVEREEILDGANVQVGDVAIGVYSSGVHSNGYSLARRALLDTGAYTLDQRVGSGRTLGEELLEPTLIYAGLLKRALRTGQVHAASHITGGGLPGNVCRVLGEGMGVRFDPARWQRPEIFDLIQRAGNIDEEEMRRTFNLGLGLVIITAANGVDSVLQVFRKGGMKADIVGEVVPSYQEGESAITFVDRTKK